MVSRWIIGKNDLPQSYWQWIEKCSLKSYEGYEHFSVLMPEKWIFVKLFAEEKEKNLFNYLENSPEGGKMLQKFRQKFLRKRSKNRGIWNSSEFSSLLWIKTFEAFNSVLTVMNIEHQCNIILSLKRKQFYWL